MTPSLSRRGLVVGALALMGGGAAADAALTGDAIAGIERQHGGRLGVFVLDTGSGRVLAHRADERFLLCSTFKGVLAGMVLARIEAGQDAAGSLVPYGARDLVGHSPVTAAHVAQGALPVEALCAAIVLFSDNGAANLLLRRVGGPEALTAYVRGLGDPVTRFDRYELAAGERSGVLDTTTPRAIVGTARTLLLGNALGAASRATLEGWMRAGRTGAGRLRAAFPGDWVTADKTGTGDGECNDYAIVRRAGQAPLLMAAYHDAPGMELAAQEAVLRAVGAAVVGWAA